MATVVWVEMVTLRLLAATVATVASTLSVAKRLLVATVVWVELVESVDRLV